MNWIENLLIIAGASLDIFAVMECQGALVKKVDKKQLSLVCIIVAILQLIALYLGFVLTRYLYILNPVSDEALLGEILAAMIFFCLGIRLIIKGVRNERIEESLKANIDMKKIIHIAGATCLYTVLSGVAFGFVGTSLPIILIMIVLVSVAVSILGTYTGYHFGFEQKGKVYIVGAALLWVAGADVVVRQILHLF